MRHKHPYTNVKLVVFNQHGLLYVLLNQKTISLDDSWSLRYDPNILISIEAGLFPLLPDLPIRRVPH